MFKSSRVPNPVLIYLVGFVYLQISIQLLMLSHTVSEAELSNVVKC